MLNYSLVHLLVRKKYLQKIEQLVSLMREFIDLAYIYGDCPERFYGKFVEKVSVDSLRKRGIIKPETLLRKPKYHRMCNELRYKDAELWTLLMIGFTPREIMVVYGIKNINSVYVKIHRLRGRLNKKMKQLINDK